MASTFSRRGGLPDSLRPPAGLVLAIGLVLALLAEVLPGLAALRDALPYLAAWTFVCWGLLAVGQLGPAARLAEVRSQDLETVRRMRTDMEARVGTLPADNPLRRDFPEILEKLDREIVPRLGELVAKHQDLGRRLADYDRTALGYRPDAATLGRLKELYGRQQTAIQGLVQQVVTMDANLLGLIQEGDEQHMLEQVKHWAEEMDFRWQGMAEVLADEPAPQLPRRKPSR